MANKSGDVGIARSHNTRQGLRSPIHRGKNFPHSIAVAIVAITTGKVFPDIPRSARAVLAFAVRLSERKDPTKASWAFKKTIAYETMISESTVYRALNVLANMGFIERFKQERKTYNGKLGVAKISLTRKTCLGLGLIIEDAEYMPKSKTTLETQTFETSPSVKLQDRHSSTLLLAVQPTQSLKKHSQILASSKQLSQGQPFFKLPKELFWLYQENLLTPPQIFLLMREFSARKQRLSEVIVAIESRIRNLPKKDVFSYLRALTKAATDFSWIAKQKIITTTKEKDIKDLKTLVQQLTGSMTGRYLRSNNSAVYLLDGIAARAWWIEGGRVRKGSCPINERFAKDYKSGCLRLINEKKAMDQIDSWLYNNQHIRSIARNNLFSMTTPM
jgi:predicted small secreted protein